jgi:hypothetical protein
MDDDILGPIDYLAVEYPDGRVTGEAFQVLMDLVGRGVLRVLDLEFIARSGDGSVRRVALDDVEHSPDVDVALWAGAESHLLDQSDFDMLASDLAPGSVASILVYENVWEAPLLAAIGRSRAQIVGAGRVTADDLMGALDASDHD